MEKGKNTFTVFDLYEPNLDLIASMVVLIPIITVFTIGSVTLPKYRTL